MDTEMVPVGTLLSGISRLVPPCDPAEAHQKLDAMKAKTYNEIRGNLTGCDCTKCLNRGDIAFVKDSGYGIKFRECDCMKIRRCVWKMEVSGLRDIIRQYTFESYKCKEEWQTKLRERAEGYAKDPSSWFLLCGQSGSGKTHLCTAISRQLLLDGHEVVYMPWREDISALKGLPLGSTERENQIARLKEAEVLYIDDLFKNGRDKDGNMDPTRTDVELAFEIINYRYNKGAPTILSTERSPQELLEIDQALGSRIMERAGENVFHIAPNRNRNYRLRFLENL